MSTRGKLAKLMHFCYFLKKFFANIFQNIFDSGAPPPGPLEADSLKCSPLRTEILAAPLRELGKSMFYPCHFQCFRSMKSRKLSVEQSLTHELSLKERLKQPKEA